MKSLQDLKQEILDGKINNFYVFFGEDYGLRHHYINKLSQSFNKVRVLDSYQQVQQSTSGVGLFKTHDLLIVYNDETFAKLNELSLTRFIDRIKDDTIIMVYETELVNTNLFKHFSNYITQFPTVKDNIAQEFVESELNLTLHSKVEMAYNCNNNYNTILIESDKVKNYSKAQNISQQTAYNDLSNLGQLCIKYPQYRVDDLMDDVLSKNNQSMTYWYQVITDIYSDQFWMLLNYVFINYLIAYFIVRYGRWEGSTRAYNCKLPWYRIKQLRDRQIPYTFDELLYKANMVAELDEDVKFNRIQQEDAFNRFLCLIY